MSNNSRCCGNSEELIKEETKNYCETSEELIKEETKNCCGNFEVTDQSKIKNPKNPKKEINSFLLKELEEKNKKMGIISIGYAKIPEEVFNNEDILQYSNTIVLTFPIGMDIIDEVPSEKTQKLNDELYKKFGNITYEISDYLRKEGFATQVAHPREELTDLSKLGQDAGLGYIGKNGLLISPELGPRLKVSAILTTIENLPFSEKNLHNWIRNYCKRCGKCIRGCLEDALIEKDDKLAKADIIGEKCIGCSQGCTYCIESCPFFEDGYNLVKAKQIRLEAKLKEKRLL